ncbi:unnamed protein product [Prunus armeniaca]|uniref:Uncharacterized protein n=1 Tax=Prunus armeniaca TaxID=36596 RepID=A0A6J5V7X7_PRUAR|nr:unnamed protein product [Prunus armeniaca]CAB4315760.1 unnamed protein product [Prunus armeniaca]
MIPIRHTDLAATILRKLSLPKLDLYELAGEVGLDLKPLSRASPDLDADIFCAHIFSEEDVKYAIHNFYASDLVGYKLVGML